MIVRKRLNRLGNEVRHQIGLRRCVGALAIMLALGLAPIIASATECRVAPEPNIPPIPNPPDELTARGINIHNYKRQLKEYHDSGKYNEDIAAVMAEATRHVLRRASEVNRRPAVVLDIDETSLSNWDNLKADDFGFIAGGTCPLQEKMPCGFDDWIDQAKAPEIKPTLDFFNALRGDKDALKNLNIKDTENLNDPGNIAVFFITGRPDKHRRATLWNLDRKGFKGWAEVVTRPDDDRRESIVPYKSGERTKIAERYAILANIGDQDSDLKEEGGKTADCVFKLPNPYYFIR